MLTPTASFCDQCKKELPIDAYIFVDGDDKEGYEFCDWKCLKAYAASKVPQDEAELGG